VNLRPLKFAKALLLLWLSIFTCFKSTRGFAVQRIAEPQISLNVDIDKQNLLPAKISGTMKITNIGVAAPQDKGKDVCFYLPFQDPEYGMNRGDMQRFQLLTANHRKPHFSGGRMSIQKSNAGHVILDSKAFLVRIRLPMGWDEASILEIQYNGEIPRLERSRAQEWVFDGFFPQLLSHCPAPEELIDIASEMNSAIYDVKISIGPEWDYLGPGSKRGGDANFSGRMTYPAFMLVKGFKKKILRIGSKEIVLAYQSEQFLDLEFTLISAFKTIEDIFGSYPLPSITIVENSELLRQTMPGLISINRPPQLVFDKVQRNLLNWQHWIAVMQLSRQWLGSMIFADSPNDEWLLSGTSEFATLAALSEIPGRFDLFNESFLGGRLFTITYLQVNEILTSMLKKNSPYEVLTGDTLYTNETLAKQNNLVFLRHTAALRQLEAEVGKVRFRGFLRKLVSDFQFKSLSPKDFVRQIEVLPSPFSPGQRLAVANTLKKWWTLPGWPDFELNDVKKKPLPGDKWLISADIIQKGGLDHEPIVKARDIQGRVRTLKSSPTPNTRGWKVEVILDAPLEEIAIDPEHRSFDSDRFNNSSEYPNFYFFPGTAKTLPDDAYTLVWVPYPFRRPGEPFSLGIQAGLFKYVQSTATAAVEFAPSNKQSSYLVNYANQWNNTSLSNGAKLQKTYNGDREIEFNFFENDLLKSSTGLGMGVVLKRKDRLGNEASIHGAYGFRLAFRPPGDERQCQFNISSSHDRAPRIWSKGFSYIRNSGLLAGECRVSHQMSLSLRGFTGHMSGEGALPESAFFKPNDLGEARLRIDQGLDPVGQIDTLTSDFYFPLYFPIPFDFLILSRQLKWRLFYDLGRARDERINYSSAGAGFQMPIGGDLAGAGSLAFTRLSLLMILQSKVGSHTIKKPSVLFDFSGQL
jgi:hypothetical protein